MNGPNRPPAALVSRRAHAPARPDLRLIALGDLLAHGADVAAQPGADALEAAGTMNAAAADVYALAYGYGGALAVPAGVRVLARVAAVLARVAGDAVPLEVPKGGRHAAA